MSILKNLKFALFLLLILLVLIGIRLTNSNLFKNDAQASISAALSNKNLLTVTEMEAMGTEYLLVNLSEEESVNTVPLEKSVQIPFSLLLNKANLEKLKNAKQIVLYSDKDSEAARAWVILNQLNVKNVFILQNQDSTEILKYKFRPDQSVRPE